jgi:hypothetical protein
MMRCGGKLQLTHWPTHVEIKHSVRLLLCAGINWLAVYVSNTAGSSDAAFDLDLTYASSAAITDVPGPVTGLTAIAVNRSLISVQWTKPICDGSSFVTNYSITLSPANVTVPAVVVSDPFQTAYSVTIRDVPVCATYTISVRAVNAAGQSSVATTSATVLCEFSLLTGVSARSSDGTHGSMFWR